MPKRIKDHLWFIQFSLWRGIAVFLLVKLTLLVALDIAIYGIIFQAGSRTSVFLPLTYWMQHHGLTAYQILMVRSGSSMSHAINDLAICSSSAFVVWRILRCFPKNVRKSTEPLSE
ncbi:hypothetical protein GOB86_12075 [Acetobacter lambici]|uniref:hypothetical protein n=1 Tax=Acetobacter lambici TaxID=1332824 RepID=UPI00140AF4E6|nr:hypothetical protein [Acetobacter lambici]NHO57780.1 hypothetical protein [Acetobacter lambici]